MKHANRAKTILAGNRSGYVAMSKSGANLLFTLFLVLLGGSHLGAIHVRETAKTPAGIANGASAVGAFGEIVRGPRGKSEIALTFDSGKEADCFDDLVAALEKANVSSTFFITGRWAQSHRDCAAAIPKHGHEVGNHTWNHLNLTKQSDDIVREEISHAEVILAELTGRNPRPFWRAPYGERDDRVLRIASRLGYRSIYWTLDSLDGVEPAKTPEFLIDRITGKSDTDLDGAIILMHVGFKSTADALPAIIANLQSRGFHLVTVSKLLETDHPAH